MGQVYVVSSGTLPDVTLSAGGVMSVFDSGTALDTTVENGGTQYVYSGGVASATALSGGVLNVGAGGKSYNAVASAGAINVSGGGVTSGTQLFNYLTAEAVVSGGESVSTTVASDASLYVDFGGKASDSVLDGGNLYDEGTIYSTSEGSGNLTVEYGVASGTVLYGSGYANVTSGGQVFDTTVSAGGSLYVTSTQYTSTPAEYYTTVYAGGNNDVDGLAVSTILMGGSQSLQGGSATNTLIESGGVQSVDYGTSSDAVVMSGGTLIEGEGFFSDSLAYGTDVKLGGVLSVGYNGTSVDAVISGGGREVISGYYGGGVASDTVLKAGADATVFSGGLDYEARIGFGAAESVAFSGYSFSAHVASGGMLEVASGGNAFGTKFAPGSMLVLAPGGGISGTTGVPTVVRSGVVTESPIDGARAFGSAAAGEKITLGGVGFVLPGGTATSFTDNSEMTVYSGGTAIDTRLGGMQGMGGLLTVYSGGVEVNAVIGSRAQMVVSGAQTSGDTVSSGGTELVKCVVNDFGQAVGGTKNDMIAGGTLHISGGAYYSGTVTFTGSGGAFIDDNATVPDIVYSGFAAGDKIQLSQAIPYNSGATVSVSYPGKVEIVSDEHGYQLNIAGAVVGETDFVFGSGGVLTKVAAPAAMGFLRPAPAVTGGKETWFDPARPAATVAPVREAAAPEMAVRPAGGWLDKQGLPGGFVTAAPVVSHGL